MSMGITKGLEIHDRAADREREQQQREQREPGRKNELRAYKIIELGGIVRRDGFTRIECKKLGPLIAYEITSGMHPLFGIRIYNVALVQLKDSKGTGMPTGTQSEHTELVGAVDRVTAFRRAYKTKTRKTAP